MNYQPTIAALALLLAVPISAQDEPTRVRLRVTSSRAAGEAAVDRGTRDGVAVGDEVELRPRAGGVYRGRVVQVSERACLVELQDRTWRPGPGTRGDVLIPAARLQQPAPGRPQQDPPPVAPPADPRPGDPIVADPRAGDPVSDPAARGDPQHPGWQEPDAEYRPGMPLLAQVRPGRPEDRPARTTGTFYSLGALTRDFEGRGQESFLRTGADVVMDNPLGRGGTLRLSAEGSWLTETNEQTGVDLDLREASYAWGGDRFSPNGWEIGRFLQGPMPEFGILDGVQWTRRLDDRLRVAASVGFLPELGEDMDTGEDLAFAGSLLWSPDNSDRLVLAVGYQKTFHKGDTDRDLFVFRGDLRPGEDWSLHGALWVDVYSGRDDIKGSGPGLTFGNLTYRRGDADGGLELGWRHQEFPELLRRGEFPPVLARELSGNRYDGISWTGWSALGDGAEVRGHATGWNDEDDSGVNAELGVASRGALGLDGRSEVTVFGGVARFTDDLGVRLGHTRYHETWHWSGLYEIGYHHLVDYPSDGDALFQHRLRGSVGYTTDSGWNGDVFTELDVQDGEFAFTLGFFVQHGF